MIDKERLDFMIAARKADAARYTEDRLKMLEMTVKELQTELRLIKEAIYGPTKLQ